MITNRLIHCIIHHCLALAVLGISLVAQSASAATSPNCHGKFISPITDICWSCLLPISMGAGTVLADGQEDSPNEGPLFCECLKSSPPRIGVKIGFWEPVRIAEFTRTPFCFVALGGVELGGGSLQVPRGVHKTDRKGTRSSFYQAHWYKNPILFYLEMLTDNVCLEEGSFDIAYMTELDPLWNDSELTLILNPDVFLFANPIAQAVCAADCVAATTGFGSKSLFWCAGCQGLLYPLTGNVAAHVGGVQATSLLMQRMTAKLHREGLMWAASGPDGLCSYYPQPLMDKTNYKSQLIYPIPNTKKINGRCCQPFGRSTAVWGAGKEFPYKGEDFAYQIFRKRNCCTGTENYTGG
jgi:conjugal transfer pilus assembly protein TraU